MFFTLRMANAELRLPAVISDHALMQANKPLSVWGWASPGAIVKVAFVGSDSRTAGSFTATAGADGRWSGKLPKLESGTAGRLEVSSDKDGSKTVNDVLIGEVWLGSGQSNMEYSIHVTRYGPDPAFPEEFAEVAHNVEVAKQEAAAAKPPIRYFHVVSPASDKEMEDVKGVWVLGDASNVETFSAVAWNFAVALQNRLHVPIGLIVSSIGGTPVEAWMSRKTLESTSAGAAVERRQAAALAAVTPEKVAQHEAAMKAWETANPTPELQHKNGASKPKILYTSADIRSPNRMYNGMIRGLEPYTLRGVIWFQADANMNHPEEYPELFQALIKEWRAEWGEQLPFYFVELNNMFEDKQTKPVQPHLLTYIREKQHAGLLLPGTGMVASIDLGTKNPHFPNKKPVGQRLAGLALRDCYGIPGQVNSPMFRSFVVEGNNVRLTFSDADGLRVRGGGEVKGFAIRGSSGDWVWASGKVEGNQIVVWSDEVRTPVAVRYAWAANPVISIENSAGLPLYPFRTDTGSKQ
jgi:sialate O-acetylesterase